MAQLHAPRAHFFAAWFIYSAVSFPSLLLLFIIPIPDQYFYAFLDDTKVLWSGQVLA